MNLEQLKKIMPDADSDTLTANLKLINDDAQSQIDDGVKALKANNGKLTDQVTKLRANQAPEDYDNDGYKKYLTDKDEFDKKQKELEDSKLADKGEWEALKLKLIDANDKKSEQIKTDFIDEVSGLKKALDKELIENCAIKEINSEKGNALFLLPHMRDFIKTVKDESGSYSVQVVDNEGKQRFQDDATTVFSVKDLVAEMKANEIYGDAFPHGNSGGGGNANSGGKGGSVANPWKSDTKNITEQGRINKENPTLALQLKKAAGV